MAFQAGLFTFLAAGLPALASRIYPRVMPQNPTLPLLVYNRISAPRVYSQSGDSGLVNSRYQFDVWAQNPDDVESLSDALITLLSGYTGAMGTENVQASFVENDADGYDAETGLFRRSVDVIFWKEA